MFTSVFHVSKKTELKCDCTGSWKSNHIVTVLVTLYTTTQVIGQEKEAVRCKMSVEMKEKVQILAEASLTKRNLVILSTLSIKVSGFISKRLADMEVYGFQFHCIVAVGSLEGSLHRMRHTGTQC